MSSAAAEPQAPDRQSVHSIRRLLVIFTLSNYRWYFSGQLVSLAGSWMMQTAIVWIVYQLTHSAFQVGLVAFLGQAPTILLSPIAGVWIDRLDRLKILMATQLFAMLNSFGLAFFVLGGHATVPVLSVFAVLLGIINAFDLPAKQVLIFMLAEKREHLPAIISMNSSLINLGRLIGPTIAGFIIAGFGTGVCFIVDGLSYLAVVASLMLMKLPRGQAYRPAASVWKDLREGVSYARNHRLILILILVSGAVAIFGLSVFTLLPAYTKEVFNGDGHILGLLMSSFSAGAAVAGFYLACRTDMQTIQELIPIGHVIAALTLALFAFSSSFSASMMYLFFMGLGCVMVVAPSNTLVQHLVEENKRGRVMSLYGMSFQGGMPLGALFAGLLAKFCGLSWTSFLSGVACLFCAVLFYLMAKRIKDGERQSLPEISLPVAPQSEKYEQASS